MILNIRLHSEHSVASSLPVVLIHGLFGSLDNLGGLARGLQNEHSVMQLDVRNHGLSPRADTMSYQEMAQDVLETLNGQAVGQFSVVGHSMGGKIAMALTALAAERVKQLVVIDIAPVAYQQRHHDAIFTALQAVSDAEITSRREAAALMRQNIREEEVVQFLLKSFHSGEWRFNLPALWQCYDQIIGWQPQPAWRQPALFIRGELSPWLAEGYREAMLAQFPAARGYGVAGAGHWVHAEKPDAVLRIVQRFLTP